MITFSNGHKFDFGCASGAMAFRGDGWWWEQPYRWLGLLRPAEFTVIIKTLTFEPRAGNLRMYAPWRAVRLLANGGAVNAVGLTNPGYKWWCGYNTIGNPHLHTVRRGYKVIVSFMPEDDHQAFIMTHAFNKLSGRKYGNSLVALQLNLSCPNVARDGGVNHICEITDGVLKRSDYPVILKLSYSDDYVQICKELDGRVAAFELINTVPFKTVFPQSESPLAQYGYDGGVSGQPIRQYAIEALQNVKRAGVRTPIISGGGIDSLEDVLSREKMGAEGFVFGSAFIRNPALPNRVINEYRSRVDN